MNKLTSELDKFWIWANMSKAEYANLEDCGDWELSYPNWDDIYNQFRIAVNDLKSSNDTLLQESILEVLVLDEDSKVARELYYENFSKFELLAERSLTHILPQTRCIVADIIREKHYTEYKDFLLRIVNNENTYVQSYALNSLLEISKDDAELIALEKLKGKNESIILFALRLLRTINSDKLIFALNLVRDVDSLLINCEKERIREQIETNKFEKH